MEGASASEAEKGLGEEVAQGPSGEQLYNEVCDLCHVSFADAPNWTANQIQEAINSNAGGLMGSLDLSPEQIAAIADALAARP